MSTAARLMCAAGMIFACGILANAATAEVDGMSREQSALEQEQLEAGEVHALTPAMTEFRQTATRVEYPSGEYRLPGYLYKPAGAGPFPAVIWNHGSEKNPTAHPELARFYTEHGFLFFVPIRHGHGRAPGAYVGDLQEELRADSDRSSVQKKIVGLHELYNLDVVAAVEWLKRQPFVDSHRVVMSGVSYGGIQTVLTTEKGLGIRAFVPFAPGAMSFANEALRERLKLAAAHSKAPMFVLQARNDYSIGPSEILAPILKGQGEPSRATIYPAFGTTHQHGHGGFACWSLGIDVWGNDVLQFIDAAMKSPSSARP